MVRGWLLILCVPLMAAACRKAPEHPLQLQTFADIRHKASFEYPAPWTLTRPLPSRLPGPDFGLEYPPSAVVAVTREEEPRLLPTDFEAAELVYAVRGGLSGQKCAALAGPQAAAIGGTLFHTGESGSRGGVQSRHDRVYSTPHGPDCLLFDLALLRAASEETRPMTDREQNDMETELTEILSSVSLQPEGAS